MSSLGTVLITSMLLGAGLLETPGELTVGDKKIALTHVVALHFDDAEGAGDGPEVRVLFTAAEAPASLLTVPVLTGLDALARAGEIEGVLIRFDPEVESQSFHGTLLQTPASPQESLVFFSASNSAEPQLRLDGDTVSGEVEYISEAQSDDGPGGFSIKVAFKTALSPCPPVSEVLEGEDCLKSAPVQAMLRFHETMLSGDLKALATVATAQKIREIQGFVDQVGEAAFKQQVAEFLPDKETFRGQIQKVYVRGDTATIIADDQGPTYFFLMKDGADWKVN